MRPRSYSRGLRNRKTYANANANVPNSLIMKMQDGATLNFLKCQYLRDRLKTTAEDGFQPTSAYM